MKPKNVAATGFMLARLLLVIVSSLLFGWVITTGWEIKSNVSTIFVCLIIGSWIVFFFEYVDSLPSKFSADADTFEREVLNKK